MSVFLETKIKGISEVQGVESHSGETNRVKGEVLRLNNEGEYTSTKFKEYLASEGIKHHLSIPRWPE